jgi:hypothetical protein
MWSHRSYGLHQPIGRSSEYMEPAADLTAVQSSHFTSLNHNTVTRVPPCLCERMALACNAHRSQACWYGAFQ